MPDETKHMSNRKSIFSVHHRDDKKSFLNIIDELMATTTKKIKSHQATYHSFPAFHSTIE